MRSIGTDSDHPGGYHVRRNGTSPNRRRNRRPRPGRAAATAPGNRRYRRGAVLGAGGRPGEPGHRPAKQIRFQQADGTFLTRWVGFAFLHVPEAYTVDEVVFGEPGDLVLLGARTLEGMNLKVDLVGKRLVSAGPMLAAIAA